MDETIESITRDIADVSIKPRPKQNKNVFTAIQSRQTGYTPAFMRDVYKNHIKRQRQNVRRREEHAVDLIEIMETVEKLVDDIEATPPEERRMLNMLYDDYNKDLEETGEKYYKTLERLADEPVKVSQELRIMRDEDEVNYPIERMDLKII